MENLSIEKLEELYTEKSKQLNLLNEEISNIKFEIQFRNCVKYDLKDSISKEDLGIYLKFGSIERGGYILYTERLNWFSKYKNADKKILDSFKDIDTLVNILNPLKLENRLICKEFANDFKKTLNQYGFESKIDENYLSICIFYDKNNNFKGINESIWKKIKLTNLM